MNLKKLRLKNELERLQAERRQLSNRLFGRQRPTGDNAYQLNEQLSRIDAEIDDLHSRYKTIDQEEVSNG